MMISPLAQSIQFTEESRKEIAKIISGRTLSALSEGDWIVYLPGSNWAITMSEREFLRFFGAKALVEDCVVKREAEKNATKIFKKYPHYKKITHCGSEGAVIESDKGSFFFNQKIEKTGPEYKSWLIEHELKAEDVEFILKILKAMPWQNYGSISREDVI